ncbi:cupin domain-containing protein [Streptomyces albidoflavus]|uniref:cupin domain-containing protein n=1 Tax=Streptomyces albidoflavus TaxID=1886 RepID=UPI0010218109|nr:cupin domain-containing protein [Streptomyces albidoflavus]RZD78011.1 cupin domain-containing protein [Streptomyces albidoflavus]
MSETVYAPAPAPAYTAGTGPIVADVSGPAQIHGVHGTTGVTRWKALASGADLRGGWEAVEWASVPPGGVSGEHLHTRTEEVYFVLSGTGEIYLDGTAHPIAPGSLVLTGLGTVHGLRNTGDGDLDWLVIEMRSPHFSAALGADGQAPPPSTPALVQEEPPVPTARLHDLRAERSVSPSGVFTGPMRSIALRTVDPAATTELSADGCEHLVFVLSGTGWVENGTDTAEIGPGTAVTLPLATRARIGADRGHRLEFFHAEVAVPGREPAR